MRFLLSLALLTTLTVSCAHHGKKSCCKEKSKDEKCCKSKDKKECKEKCDSKNKA